MISIGLLNYKRYLQRRPVCSFLCKLSPLCSRANPMHYAYRQFKLYAMLFSVISATFVKFHQIVPLNNENFVPVLLLCVYMVLKSKSFSQRISRLEMGKKNRLLGQR